MLHSEIATEYPAAGEAGAAAASFEEPHPVWRPHLLQGWAPDFIPKLVDDATRANLYDEVLHVGGDASMRTAKDLAQKEGLFTGPSGGGCVACALEVAKTLPKGSTLVAMLPDTGERYLSTPLFADIPADMTDEEKAIAASTKSEPPPPIVMPEVSEEAQQFVQATNAKHKVVVWSLEYCEFCWTIFKLLDAIGTPAAARNPQLVPLALIDPRLCVRQACRTTR